MLTHTEVAPKSTRTREVTSPDVLSRRDGVFWGAVLLLVGILWFLNALEVINLGAKFVDIILPSKNNLVFVHWASRAMWCCSSSSA